MCTQCCFVAALSVDLVSSNTWQAWRLFYLLFYLDPVSWAGTHSPGLRQHSGKEWHTMIAGRSDSAGGRICMDIVSGSDGSCSVIASLPDYP
jgi:hypothetical protein